MAAITAAARPGPAKHSAPPNRGHGRSCIHSGRAPLTMSRPNPALSALIRFFRGTAFRFPTITPHHSNHHHPRSALEVDQVAPLLRPVLQVACLGSVERP